MKLITFIIRPDRLPAVKEALFRAGVTGITLSRASGHGGEQDRVAHDRGGAVVLEFQDTLRLELVCSEPYVQPTIDAIIKGARTGEVGAAKIVVQPIERVIRIRTGEQDNAALTPLNADEVRRKAMQPA